jgi:hypothetical protein
MEKIIKKRNDEYNDYKQYTFVKDFNFTENIKGKTMEKLNDIEYSNYIENHDENIKLQKVGPEYKNYILLNDKYKKLLEFYEKYVTYSLKKPYFKGLGLVNNTSKIFAYSFEEQGVCIDILKPSDIKWFNHYNKFQYVLFNLNSNKNVVGYDT